MTNPATKTEAPVAKPIDSLESMLGIIISQIRAALDETNAPAGILVETAHSMGKATEIVARCLFDFSKAPTRVFQDLMVLHDDLHARAAKAATAIQFHDRLIQCLTHVCSSLTYLGEFAASGSEQKTPAEWNALRERIRSLHSMEQELLLYDLLSNGASEEEKSAALAKGAGSQGGAGNVELF